MQGAMDLTIDQAMAAGTQLLHDGKHREAASFFRGIVAVEPNNLDAVERLGTCLHEIGEYFEALYWFWRGRDIDCRNPLALSNFGLIWSQLGHPEKGLPDLERATAIADRKCRPEIRAVVWNNLGNTLEKIGRHRDALAALERGIAQNPHDPFPHYNRVIALMRLARHREGIAALDKAISLYGPNPNPREVADCRYNRGIAKLTLGEIKEGFEDLEYRLLTTGQEINHGFPYYLKWDGKPLAGDLPLIILAEWGLGDTIQFLRFVPEALRCARKVSVAVQTGLAPMVKECWPEVTILPAKTVIRHEEIGAWVAVMSLAHLFGVEKESDIPLPWMPPLGNRVLAPCGRLRIGVCWAGNVIHKNDRNRSIPLDVFAKMFELDASFVSLQQLRQEDKALFADLETRHDNLFSFDLDDLRDTATLIANCDLVISADTAIAHLAASIGIPTWILVPPVNVDWRWRLQGDKCAWYPAATLWRGRRATEWRDVIDAMMAKLSTLREEAA